MLKSRYDETRHYGVTIVIACPARGRGPRRRGAEFLRAPCAFRLFKYRRYASALARLVHRGCKSDYESALHELPPGRRSSHARQRHASAFAARPARGRRRRRVRATPAARVISNRNNNMFVGQGVSFQSIPGILAGALRRSRWPGKENRSAKSASKSKTHSAMVDAASSCCTSTWRTTTWSRGVGRLELGAILLLAAKDSWAP